MAGQQGGEGGSGAKRGDKAKPPAGRWGRGQGGSDARGAGGLERADRLRRASRARGGAEAAGRAELPGPGVELCGGAQQRGEDAAVATPQSDAGDAGPQEAVLELEEVPHRQTEEDEPVPAPGDLVATGAL